MIHNNIFEQMKVFKMIRAKQNLFSHFVKAFPYALETFSEADIKYNILKIWKYNLYKKGETIQKEFLNSKGINMIISGTVGVSKLINFENEKYEPQINDEKLLEMHPIDLIGEDKLWFKRPNQYTAKAISGSVETYYISNGDFKRSYERIMQRVQ